MIAEMPQMEFLILALLLLSECADATVYKCVEGGRTRYQSTACAAGVVVPIDEAQPSPAPPEAQAPAAASQAPLAYRPRRARSAAAKNRFKALWPCPSTGEGSGPCPGYVVDHIRPLACGGADEPRNMQWQTTEAAKAKDRWERDGCQPARHAYPRTAGGRVYTGPRGGRFTYSGGGRRYQGRRR